MILALAASGLMAAFVHLVCFSKTERFEAEEDDAPIPEFRPEVFTNIINAFFETRGNKPSPGELRTIAEMIEAGELNGNDAAEVNSKVRKMAGAPVESEEEGGAGGGDQNDPSPKSSKNIEIGEAQWTFGRLGFSTITVPYSIKFPVDAPDASSVLEVKVHAPAKSTFVSSLDMDGEPAPKRTTGSTTYEFTIIGTTRGEIKLVQSAQQTDFSLRLSYRGEGTERLFHSPEESFPPDDANSPNVILGQAQRVQRRVRIPFEIVQRREGDTDLRVVWRAPGRTTFFNEVELTGITTPVESRAVSANAWDTSLLGSARTGIIDIQQTPGGRGAPEFTLWAKYGDDVTSIVVPGDYSDEFETGDAPTLPEATTPVEETVDDMVDLDAFPHRQRQPVQTRVTSASHRIQFDIPTVQRVSHKSMGYVLRVPFRLMFARGEVPGGTKLRVSWDLDPATTQLRYLKHADREIPPTRPMETLDALEAVAEAPTSEPSVLVFDQPLGRRAISLTLAYAGESTTVLLAGSQSEARGAGFVGQKKPIDFDGNPPIRFTDVHESAEERVRALYKTNAGVPPDEQTTKFLMSKYFEWDGDLARVSNLVSTISTVVTADPGDDMAAAVQRAIASLEAGASPGQTKDALKHWKEYETHRAMWRPDQSNAGYPGATSLKRPWSDAAVALAEGHSSDLPAVAANTTAFDVAPGQSQDMIGQGHWMF